MTETNSVEWECMSKGATRGGAKLAWRTSKGGAHALKLLEASGGWGEADQVGFKLESQNGEEHVLKLYLRRGEHWWRSAPVDYSGLLHSGGAEWQWGEHWQWGRVNDKVEKADGGTTLTKVTGAGEYCVCFGDRALSEGKHRWAVRLNNALKYCDGCDLEPESRLLCVSCALDDQA